MPATATSASLRVLGSLTLIVASAFIASSVSGDTWASLPCVVGGAVGRARGAVRAVSTAVRRSLSPDAALSQPLRAGTDNTNAEASASAERLQGFRGALIEDLS